MTQPVNQSTTFTITTSKGNQAIDVARYNQELISFFNKALNIQISSQDHYSQQCHDVRDQAVREAKRDWRVFKKSEVQDALSELAVRVDQSLLGYGIKHGSSWTEDFISNEIDIHSIDQEGNTALHIAAREGKDQFIGPLSKHLKLDETNRLGQTPLSLAIYHSKAEVVKELLNHGASLTTSIPRVKGSPNMLFPDEYAVAHGKIECLSILRGQGQSQHSANLIQVAVCCEQNGALRYLLENLSPEEKTILLNHINDYNHTPLVTAVRTGKLEAVKEIIKYKQDYLNGKDSFGRTLMHHAAETNQHSIIQFLAKEGAGLESKDNKGKTPLDLILGDGPAASSCRGLLNNLIAKSKKESAIGFQPPKNLVFKGGGPKGLAYIGALKCLNEQGKLSDLQRVAGTSAGAITASLVAIGYPIDQLEALLTRTDLMSFIDSERLKEIIQIKDNYTVQVISALRNIRERSFGVIHDIQSFIGFCDGEGFRTWLEGEIEKITEKKFLTFGELAQLVKNEPKKYRHLHVYATEMTNQYKHPIYHMSSEDNNQKDIIISDAIRASMSIPGVFKPHTLHIMKEINGERIRLEVKEFGSFLDGGMLNNFPIETFDNKKYTEEQPSSEQSDLYDFNPHTLGLTLVSKQKPQTDQDGINDLTTFIASVTQVYYGAEEAIRDARGSNNVNRVVEIDPVGVTLLEFNMEDETKKMLLDSGHSAMRAFIHKRTAQEPEPLIPRFQAEDRFTLLKALRNASPEKYPSYLDEVLKDHHNELFDHLIDMIKLEDESEKNKMIEKLPFSSIAKIAMQLCDAIISRVNLTPQQSKNVLFLLGRSGAGKSTALCFLRGDQMTLDKAGRYHSTQDKDAIGCGKDSCTLLPSFEQVHDLTVVDFPGFSDTRGTLVDLGMELALKHLTKKYQPKILMMESVITDEKYRYQSDLRKRLDRLFIATPKCILGLTHYSDQKHFIKIRKNEAEQRKAQSEPTREEERLKGKINNIKEALEDSELPAALVPSWEQKLKEAEVKLATLEQRRKSSVQQPLAKTEESESLGKVEDEICKMLKVQDKLHFFDLETEGRRKNMLQKLQTMANEGFWIYKQGFASIDFSDLSKKFNEEFNFTTVFRPPLDRIETFCDQVQKSTLVEALFEETHPDVIKFLKLDEVGKELLRTSSENLVNHYIGDIVDSVTEKMDRSKTEEFINNYQQQMGEETAKKLRKAEYELIKTVSQAEKDRAQISEEDWTHHKKQLDSTLEKTREKAKIEIVQGWCWVSRIIQEKFRWWDLAKEAQDKVNEVLKNTINQYSEDLKKINHLLIKLLETKGGIDYNNDLKKHLAQFKHVEEQFYIGDFLQNIDHAVQKTKKHYGEKIWETRFKLLSEKLSNVDIPNPLALYLAYGPTQNGNELKFCSAAESVTLFHRNPKQYCSKTGASQDGALIDERRLQYVFQRLGVDIESPLDKMFVRALMLEKLEYLNQQYAKDYVFKVVSENNGLNQ